MSLRTGSAWWLVGLLVGCGTNSSSPSCETGTLRCACYRNQSCDSGLVCMSDICVADPNSAGASASAGKSATTGKAQGGAAIGGQLGTEAGQSAVGQGGTTATRGSDVAAIAGSTAVGAAGSMVFSGGSNAVTAATGGVNLGGNAAGTGGLQMGSGGTGIAGAGSPNSNHSGGMSNGGGNTIGTLARGGTTATTSLGTAGPACTSSTNIIADALNSPLAPWFGGDPAIADDNVCGAQGQVQAYGDKGVDNIPGTSDDSCPWAIYDGRPDCSGGKCCISGKTVTWPHKANSSALDYNASVWGCGLQVDLNRQGIGGTLQAYTGPLKGLNLVLSGNLNGQAIRIGFMQTPTDASPPFVPGRLGEYYILFTDPTCPSWATSSCLSAGKNPYAVQITVVGGDTGGDFTLCLEAVRPVF